MKKQVSIVLIAAFLAFFTTNANAVVNPGTTCKKLGLTSSFSGKKYTCVKSGKKLVWNKGVAVKPIPTPTPTPNKTPTSDSNTISEPSSQLPAWGESTRINTYKRVHSWLIDSSRIVKNQIQIESILSPNVDRDKVHEFLGILASSLKVYSHLLTTQVTVVFFTEKDEQWWRLKSSELESSSDFSWWSSGHCEITSRSLCGYGSNSVPYALQYLMLGTESSGGHHLDHEAVHILQKSLIKNSNFHPVCWSNEGFANSLGHINSYTNSGSIWTNKSFVAALDSLNRITGVGNWRTKTVDEWKNVLKNFENNPECFQQGTGYSLGMVIFDYLFTKYQPSDVFNFYINLSETSNTDKSLRAIFGISSEDLWDKVANELTQLSSK